MVTLIALFRSGLISYRVISQFDRNDIVHFLYLIHIFVFGAPFPSHSCLYSLQGYHKFRRMPGSANLGWGDWVHVPGGEIERFRPDGDLMFGNYCFLGQAERKHSGDPGTLTGYLAWGFLIKRLFHLFVRK